MKLVYVKKLLFRQPSAATVSLRLGHARVLTSHRDVIHCAHAASLPDKGRLKDTGRRGRRPLPLGVGYNHACRAVPWCRRLFFGVRLF